MDVFYTYCCAPLHLILGLVRVGRAEHDLFCDLSQNPLKPGRDRLDLHETQLSGFKVTTTTVLLVLVRDTLCSFVFAQQNMISWLLLYIAVSPDLIL